MKKIVILLLLSVTSLLSFAPVSIPDPPRSKEYPKGYFRNPLGIPIQLAANFGELRTNHFHMGFDIRTNQRENLPVYAAAEGYISRIKIEHYGFGRAIYINHPNGYTTVYAHLNDFYPALHNYIKNKQYEDQQWEQEFEFEPSRFPVTKGQFIAFSGNTGGSQGPHLHFEIRDTETGNNLNPWLFGFGLSDRIPPYIYGLYYYDRRYSTYEVKPVRIPITGANGSYSSANNMVVLPSPEVSFGIFAEDKTTLSPFRFGIYEALLTVDSTERAAFRLDDISYNDTRYLNGSIDYKTRLSGGTYIQHLSRLPGNFSTIFSGAGDGSILLTDTLVHNAEIRVNDANGNSTLLKFKFRRDPSKMQEMMFAANSIPLLPAKSNQFKTDDLEADFSDKAFYDTVPFVHRSETSADTRTVSAIHYLHHYTVPVHDSFTVRIKPVIELSDSLRNKTVMLLKSNRKEEAVKGEWKGEWMEAKFRDLGTFRLVMDTIPPRVTLAGWKNGGSVRNRKSILLTATDNVSDLKKFTALLDGNWLMFSRKNDTFIHTFDERTSPGEHELKVIVEDMAGNITERIYSFIR
jgi:hypothetical protein